MLKIKSLAALLFLCVCVIAAAPAAQAQVGKFAGKPDFSKGSDLGYFVWFEGGTWKVRWTTTGTWRNFTGHVTALGGELKSLKRVDVETERKVIRPGHAPRVVVGPRGRVYRRGGAPPIVAERKQDVIEKDGAQKIRFNSRTDDDIDGFDFKVDDQVTALRFVLEINGNAMPGKVEVGKNNQHPPNVPFEVRLR